MTKTANQPLSVYLREEVESAMSDRMDIDVGIPELAQAAAARVETLFHADRASLAAALSDLMKAYAACNGEDHPAYARAERALVSVVAPRGQEEQQALNAAAVEIICYGADIPRLTALQKAWAALEHISKEPKA